MADNFLERHHEIYELRKVAWLKKEASKIPTSNKDSTPRGRIFVSMKNRGKNRTYQQIVYIRFFSFGTSFVNIVLQEV